MILCYAFIVSLMHRHSYFEQEEYIILIIKFIVLTYLWVLTFVNRFSYNAWLCMLRPIHHGWQVVL